MTVILSDTEGKAGRRARTALGLAVVAGSLGLTAAVAGIGFAGTSTSAAQYQYGKTTICHHTHSKKHPNHTIRIGKNAWRAHQRHGDTLGACALAPLTGKQKHGHGQKGTHGKPQTSTTTPTTTTPAPTGGHANGGDAGHGNGKGHGK